MAKLHPRAEAFEKLQQREICKKEGHKKPYRDWYSTYRDKEPCLRCGELVDTIIDWDGHP